ncbi:hypothetical protein B0T10DRAFT_5266 [Thelonectria olida]|uniref:SP-RING-type domain-containing protein n=1 Tax=Thelonectria olida TaxID=1576542 RepID=A0A9P8WHV1_9HYPO|nr:hypothetical protein B0T10DRAFT_5266 [Thelonectria olida]
MVPNNAVASSRPDAQIVEQAMASASGMTAPQPVLPAGASTTSPQVSQGANAPISARRVSHNIHRPSGYQQESGEGNNPRLEAVTARMAQLRKDGCNESDMARYRVLKDSCERKDLLYVALHQLLCRWSLDKNIVFAALSPCRTPANVIDRGFQLTETFLKSNGCLSFDHLQWFAHFPETRLEVCRLPQPLAVWVARFLERLCAHWEPMLKSVSERKYPLLACEINLTLSCTSPTLQPVLFTMSYRSLNITDTTWGTVLNDTFAQELQNEHALATNPPTQEEAHRIRSTFVHKYMQIINRAQQQQQQYSQQQYSNQNAPYSPTMRQQTSTRQPRRSFAQTQPVAPHSHSGSPAMAAAPSPVYAQPGAQGPGRVVSGPMTFGTFAPQANMSGQDRNRQYQYATSGPAVVLSGYRSFQHWASSQASPPTTPGPASMPPSPYTWTQIAQSPLQPPVVPSNSQMQETRSESGGIYQQQPVAGPAPQNQGLQYPPHMPQLSETRVATPALATIGQPSSASVQQQQTIAPRHSVRALPSQLVPPRHQEQDPSIVPVAQAPGPPPPGRLHTPIANIPTQDYPMSPFGQHSLQVGLHQVGLRSPKRIPKEPVEVRFYQYIQDLVVPPRAVLPQVTLHKIEFDVPAANLSKLAKKNCSAGLPYCLYGEGSYRYRTRICSRPSTETSVGPSDWTVAAATWPDHIFITFNDTPMVVRRKQHFHKDLPLELTDNIIAGKNTLTISIPNVRSNYRKRQNFFIAVELVQTSSHERLKKFVFTGKGISADLTMQKIKRRLRPLESDDIFIENDVLKISLADPFSSSMFETPVRSVHCQHLECFDLDTWLRTRPRKPTQKGRAMVEEETEPSTVDDWKCPICGCDARPIRLLFDHFLAQVRNVLLARGETNVKAISVNADGQWQAIEEPNDSANNTPNPTADTLSKGGLLETTEDQSQSQQGM